MLEITLDAELNAKLKGMHEPIKILDENGESVGRYLPEDWFLQYFNAWVDANFSEEDLEAARRDYRERGGMTTKEALEYLKRIQDSFGEK